MQCLSDAINNCEMGMNDRLSTLLEADAKRRKNIFPVIRDMDIEMSRLKAEALERDKDPKLSYAQKSWA